MAASAVETPAPVIEAPAEAIPLRASLSLCVIVAVPADAAVEITVVDLPHTGVVPFVGGVARARS